MCTFIGFPIRMFETFLDDKYIVEHENYFEAILVGQPVL